MPLKIGSEITKQTVGEHASSKYRQYLKKEEKNPFRVNVALQLADMDRMFV